MMKSKKLETYDPKKRFIEKVVPLLKPGLRILAILAIVLLTVAATEYVLDRNDIPEGPKTMPRTSNQVTGNAVYDNDVQTRTATPAMKKVPAPVHKAVDYSTLTSDLLRSDIVQDLPKGALLRLQFYNFNSGVREWERSYNLGKDSVEEGSAAGDIQIIMDSKYVREFKTRGACAVLTSANNNGDFGADTEMSDSALIWKYKSMMKYRDCLGL